MARHLMLGLFLGFSAAAVAQEDPAEIVSGSSTNPRIYNFDADVIVGDKKAPDLVFQSGKETIDFEALLLNRKDFNDFLRFDQSKHPDFFE